MPGASTVSSQLLDRIPSLWLADAHNPAMRPHSRNPSHWLNQWKEIRGWGGVGERLNNRCTKPLRIATQPLQNARELEEDPSRKQLMTKKRRSTWAFTADRERLLSSWRLTLLNYRLTKFNCYRITSIFKINYWFRRLITPGLNSRLNHFSYM